MISRRSVLGVLSAASAPGTPLCAITQPVRLKRIGYLSLDTQPDPQHASVYPFSRASLR